MNLLHEIGSHLTGLEQLKVMMKNVLRPGIGETLGVRLIEVEEGRVVLEATPDLHLYNPIGTVHGGFAATMLDFACGYAVLSKLTPGMRFSTLELKVAYHKPITKDTGPVRAEGTIVTMGRQAAFTDARLVDVHGRHYAAAQRQLETTDAAVDWIAQECGLGTGATFRLHFKRVVGVSPTDYRKTFRRDLERRAA